MLTPIILQDDPANAPGDDDPDPSRADEPAQPANLIAVSPDHPQAQPYADWLAARLAEVITQLNTPLISLSLALVDDATMAKLHDQYLGDPTTTDVITFDLADQPRTIEGELVLCVDQARRQADLHNHSIEHELLLYAVHGVLHLLGYDDHDPDQARKMHAEEDRLLTLIGVGPVYAVQTRNAPG
ncbi:MAG: rRNA maturation RNase YbeY [Phycisphaeraceae bacterium]